MKETYKDIEGFEGLYQVSDMGNIKSLNFNRTGKEGILKNKLDNYGYYIVNLYKDRKSKTRRIHQLLAIAFLNHVPNKMKLVINHKDFIKTNNRLDNLEIVTNRENANHKHLSSSSKYTGVSWHKRNNKWIASININGKQKHLGYFIDELEASNAYESELKKINEK